MLFAPQRDRPPQGTIPSHWTGPVHEDEGGKHEVGRRHRCGRNILKYVLAMLHETGRHSTAWDDATVMELDVGGVMKAREVEMQFFEEMNAYSRCPRECAVNENGKIIDLKWIDINIGDSAKPLYRSRLVGRVYINYKDDSLFAAAPPIEARTTDISFAASTQGEKPKDLMINNVSRAYFHAPTQ